MIIDNHIYLNIQWPVRDALCHSCMGEDFTFSARQSPL